MLCPSDVKLGTCISPRELWKLWLIDGVFYPLTEVSVFQSWNERIRSPVPIYPFTLGIVFQLALRLCISSQMQNINILSALIFSYQDISLKFMVIPRLCTVANNKWMGKVWQTLPLHLSLHENKTRQLLIINNREISQGESYPIKTSPVNLAGRLAKLGNEWRSVLCSNHPT